MYRLHGFFTQNTLKTLYVMESVGAEYEFEFVDLFKGGNRTDAFRAMTPVGKVPLLEHNGETLFESGAICRYVASEEKSPLYPADKLERARVDQWMTFFSCHAGRWLTELYWQKIMKPGAGIGETDAARCDEAERFTVSSLKAVERQLEGRPWLANDTLSIAEPFALGYLEQAPATAFDLSAFPNVLAWYRRVEELPAVGRVRERIEPYRANFPNRPAN
jgi:glutathione S-transferase